MADVKTRAYYAPYDNDYYIPDAEGEKRVGKNENWRDIEKGFYLVQAKNDEQDSQFAAIEAKDEEQDGRLDAIEAKDEEQDGRLDAIEAVNTQQNLDIQTNRTNITGLDTRLTSAEALLDAVSQTSVENSAAIAQLQTDQQTLSGRLDTTNAQLADNSARLTRAENNITTLQSDAAQASQDITALQGRATALEEQAVIRLQATFDRQAETVTLTDPAAAYEALSSGHNAVIDLLIDNSFASIYTKDIDNSTNNTYRFTHAETGVDAGGRGYTGLDAITITLDPLTETVSTVSWSQVYNDTREWPILTDFFYSAQGQSVNIISANKLYNNLVLTTGTKYKPNTTYRIINIIFNPLPLNVSGTSLFAALLPVNINTDYYTATTDADGTLTFSNVACICINGTSYDITTGQVATGKVFFVEV